MADVFPPRDLPGRAEEWGRQVERRIESGEASEQQLEQKVDNGLRATGGQLAVLARQIDALTAQQVAITEQQLDLAGRTSMSSADLVNRSYNSTSNNTLPNSIVFTIDRARKVRLTFSSQMMANTAPSGTNAAAGHLTFALDGIQLPANDVARGFVSASTVTVPYLNASASANALLTLPAGSYEVAPMVTVTVSGTAAITATNNFLFVDILEPA